MPFWRVPLCALVLVLAACGGGGGGGSDDDDNDIGISYVGNRNAAVLSQGNMVDFTVDTLSTDALGYAIGGNVYGARGARADSSLRLSLTESALITQRFARRSLERAGIVSPAIGARAAGRVEIDETEFCDSGQSRITGVVENDLTGEVEIDYQQCRYGQITFDGRLRWTIHAVDQANLVPTHSTFTISALTVTTPLESTTLGGVIGNRLDFFANLESLEMSNLIVRDNSSGAMTMATDLWLSLQYDNIAFPNFVDHSFMRGRIYDSIHGYVEVFSPQALRFDDIYDDQPITGQLQLSGIGRLTVYIQPGSFVEFALDTDEPPDGLPEYQDIVPWDSLFDPGIPTDNDIDNDNLPNTWELANGLDPQDPADALQDFDFDGFDNITEYLNGTDPNDGDSMPPLSELWRPAPGSTPVTGDFVYLESEAGDYIGGGNTYLYTDANAVLDATTNGGRLTITVMASGSWTGQFQLPVSETQVTPGYRGQVLRYPFHDSSVGGLSWTGMGRGCNQSTGWFIVDSVTYDNGSLSDVELRFGQHCENWAPALRGQLRWTDTPADPPDPPDPPPGGLWEPAPGTTPASGNYIYLESQTGDYIGQGANYLYTDADAVMTFNAPDARLNLSVVGDESWSATFQSPNSLTELAVGYFGDLSRYPFHNPVLGGLSWSGEGRGCNTIEGWFVIDSLTYAGSSLTAIEMRFEQRCGGSTGVLNGKIRWDVNDVGAAPGPVVPPPAGLWQAPAGVLPASGNYIYLESQAGDYIGGGGVYLYTGDDSIMSVTASPDRLDLTVTGDERWTGDFQAMNSLTRLEPGYYGNLQRWPFHNPTRGGLSWSGEGRGCNRLEGWFVVDSVSYVGDTLTDIELRFEQRCDSSTGVLRGQIYWSAANPSNPPGPVNPPPAGLWEAPAGVLPGSGNYVYLESQPGDFIGQGGVYLYTNSDSILDFVISGARLNVDIEGDEEWRADFQAMYTLAQLEPGYYGNLERYPFHNPARGGLSWGGEGRGCNTSSGWFVIDSISFNGSDLSEVQLRFEQRCGSSSGVLRGQLYWSAANPTTPPGPIDPPPAGLWDAPGGATPTSGNYVYLQSTPGDYIGGGGTYLYTDADTTLSFSDNGGRLDVNVNGAERWNATFQAMFDRVRLEPGYYGNLQRWPFHNPVRGGLSWSGEGRGCNRLSGWFVVDSVTYTGIDLTAIELRFEQRCEETGPPLNGKLRWSQ